MELKEDREHIFRSKLPDIYIPNHLPIHTYCFQNLSGHRSWPALINAATGETLTHADVDLIARRAAVGLHGLGVRRRHVVMLLLHNSPEFALAFLAASLLGASATTANPNYTAAEIASQARITDPRLIVTHACYVGKVRGAAEELGARIVTVDTPPSPGIVHFAELAKSDERSLPTVEIRPDDTAALLFSSGTTGLPKGVMLSHRNVVTCVAQKVDGENPNLHVDGGDLMLCVLPLFHVFGLAMVLLNLRVGGALVIVPKFEIDVLLELIQRYRVTVAPLVPPILVAIAKSEAAARYDLSSVRKVYSGAAPLSKELEAAVLAKLPNAIIGQGYGMTESGVISICLGFAKKPFKYKSGSCGSLVRNTEMKIVDPVSGVSLCRNQTGEICVRGDSIMKGYYKDPEATRRTIDGDGWLHTGDIGYVDGDDELFIVDRLKELIKHKGFHVAPAELEALLIAHPSISDAAVVPMKDETAGEVPVAFVVRANGSKISEQDVKQYISKQVVSYKRIHRVFFTNEIPKAPSGKILRKNLRSRI